MILATDGSSESWQAVAMLKNLGLPANSRVMLLHVIRKHLYETGQIVDRGNTSWETFAKAAKHLSRDRGASGVNLLKKTQAELAESGFHCMERIAFGHEAKEILKAARKKKRDSSL